MRSHLLDGIRLASLVVLALAVAFVGTAPAERDQAQADPYEGAAWLEEAVPVTQPFLWRVTPPAAQGEAEVAPSYLFGTIHGGVRFEEVMLAPVREAFESAHLVLVELDEEQLAEAGQQLAQRMSLPEGERLTHYVDKDTVRWVSEFAGVEPQQLDQFEPWAVMLMFVMPATLPPVEIEAMDLEFARAENVRALERAADQVRVLTEQPREFWAASLAEAAQTWPEPRTEMAEMIEAYRTGDAEALQRMIFAEADDELQAQFIEALLLERNRDWMPAITEAVDQGGAFVAAGAGHFLGEGSVNDRLEQHGYTVERVLVEPAEPDPFDDVPWIHEPVPVEEPFLWRVTSPAGADGDEVAPSYLFGTIHDGVRFEEVMLPPVREAFDSARIVFTELSTEELEQVDVLMVERMFLPHDESLSDFMDAEAIEQLAEFVEMERETLERLEPWIILLGFIAPLSSPPMDVVAMDDYFAQHENAHGLETAEEQINGLTAVPRSFWVASIEESVATWPQARRESLEMIEAYRAGDAEAVMSDFDALDREDEAVAQFLDGLLYERNRAWMPRIAEAVDEGGAFVAVGVAHLIGEGSVTDLLQQAGYEIERVSGVAAEVE